MLKAKNRSGIRFLLALMTSVLAGWGQSSPQPTYQGVRGISPTGVYTVNNLETIDPVSGNMMVKIPITAHAPVRGNSTADLWLVYNSNIFDLIPDGNGGTVLAGAGGWQYSFEYSLAQELSPATNSCGAPGSYPIPLFRMVLTFPDGSGHTLHLYNDPSDVGDGFSNTDGVSGVLDTICPNTQAVTGPLTYHTSDGTFVKVVVNPDPSGNPNNITWTAYFPGGKNVQGQGFWATSITDRNGNTIYIQNFIGAIGATTVYSDGISINGISGARDIKINRQASPNPSPFTFQDQISQNGPGGASVTWTVNYRHIPTSSLKYPCPVADNSGGLCPVDQTTGIDSLVLPSFDGSTQKFQFGYDTDSSPSGGWGQLSLIIPPTAPASCNSTALSNCPYFAYSYEHGEGANFTGKLPGNRITQKQTTWVEDQTNTAHTDTWNYLYLIQDANNNYTQIKNPDGGVVSTYYYTKNYYGLGSGQCAVAAGLVSKIVQPDQSTVERVWQQNLPFYPPSPQPGVTSGICDPGNPYVMTEYRSVSNGSAPQAESGKTFSYDKNGNLWETDDHGWAQYSTSPSPSGSLIRTTKNTYTVSTNAASNSADTTTAYWNPSTNPPWNVPQPATAPLLLDRLRRNEVDDVSGFGPGSVSEFSYDANGNTTDRFDWDSTKAPTMPSLGSLSPTNSSWRHFVYDSYGNLTNSTDPLCTTTHYTYDSVNNLLLTNVTEDYRGITLSCTPQGPALTRATGVVVDSYSGLEQSRTDYNGITRAKTYDPLGRPTSVTDSAGSQTLHVAKAYYSDGKRRVTHCTDLVTPGDLKFVTVTSYDQVGRVNGTGTLESGNPNASQCFDTAPSGILTDTRYLSGTGATYKLASNPYRSTGDATMGWTLTTLDQNGRVTSVASYDGSTPPSPWGGKTPNTTITGNTTTSYGATSSSETRTIFDQIATRALTLDALTRVTSVTEAGTTITNYAYDGLDNLQSVTQSGLATLPGQTGVTQPCSAGVSRCFRYDSLRRLTWATNPESGTTSYLYDANGNATSKTDARGVATTLNYDALSRLTGKTYNDGITPSVTYSYDVVGTTACPSPPVPAGTTNYPIGRLTSVSSSVSSYSFDCYDAMGRVLHASQTTNSQTYPFTLAYNAGGSPSSETYPSGRVVKYTYDNAGRTATVVNGPTSYATIPINPSGYAPNGAISSVTYGSNLVESTNFNQRFQPTGIQAQYHGTTLLSLTYYYCPTQQLSCSNNNGNVQSQTITRTLGTQAQTWNQSYSYTDGKNRLTGAAETGPGTGWTENYGFDSIGNRWIANAPSPGLPAPTSEVPQAGSWYQTSNLTNNRINLWNYDNAGNISSIPGMQRLFSYDAEGRQLTAATTVNGTTTTTTYSYDGDGRRITKSVGGAASTVYVYDPMGQLAAEYGAVPADIGTVYLTADTLGSTRLKTDSAGATKGCYDYLPFGSEILSGIDGRTSPCFNPAADSFYPEFTGKERDAETGLDWFDARYFSSAQGRFTSPDPIFIAEHRYADPQMWNLYTYARNNPLRFTDSSGLDVKLNCTSVGDQACAQTVSDLNNRKDAQFQVSRDDKTGLMVASVDDPSKLLKSEAELYKAINDHSQTSELKLVPSDSGIFGDQFVAKGLNIVDRADLTQFGKANSALPGEIIAHAAVEGFESLKQNLDNKGAHDFANQFFGAIRYTDPQALPAGSRVAGSGVSQYTFGRIGVTVNVQKVFVTPQPANSVSANWERIRGNIVVSTSDKKQK